MKKDLLNVEYQIAMWNQKAVDLFFDLMHEKRKGDGKLNADDLVEKFRTVEMPSLHIAKNTPRLIKSGLAQGYLTKTKEFTLSKRHGSRVLPIYVVNASKLSK